MVFVVAAGLVVSFFAIVGTALDQLKLFDRLPGSLSFPLALCCLWALLFVPYGIVYLITAF